MHKDCPATYFVYVNSHSTGSGPNTQASCPGESGSLGQVPVARFTHSALESSYSTIAQLSPQANLIRPGGNTDPSLTPVSSTQGSHSDPREKANVTATTSLHGLLCLRMFPMAVIQSKVALKLWTENSCTAKLQNQDLEQARVPWLTIPLAVFCLFSLNKTWWFLAVLLISAVHTYFVNWSKSVMSQHPLASFGFFPTFKNVRLWIPDPASSFQNAKYHTSHTHFSPPTSCQIPLPILTPEQILHTSSCEIIHFFPTPLKSKLLSCPPLSTNQQVNTHSILHMTFTKGGFAGVKQAFKKA